MLTGLASIGPEELAVRTVKFLTSRLTSGDEINRQRL